MNIDPRFLCIDDSPASRSVLKLLLVDVLGFAHVKIMACSKDLVEQLTADAAEFDAIFLDLNMEPLDGITMLHQFRASKLYAHMPILACTASAAPDEMEQIRAAGFDGLVAKPIDPIAFPMLIPRILNREAVWENGM